MSIVFLSFIERDRDSGQREREREKRKLEAVVRDTTLGVGSSKQYLRFRRFPGSAR
jgi:hypothetical protein